MSHVRELTDEVSEATELGKLQSAVGARLESVARQVGEFRAREQIRTVEYNGRAERMRARIANLERETQELHSKLAMEKHGARLDPLTGVANRKSFDERFAQEIGRVPGSAPADLLLWDIDNFKGINDSYGHRAGDRVLQSVAGCFVTALRSSDFVARIGGEEFAVVLPETTYEHALEVARKLRVAVASTPFTYDRKSVEVTASFGLCGLDRVPAGERQLAQRVLKIADAALYRSKNGGRNRVTATMFGGAT